MSFEASKAVFNGGSEADDGSTIFVQKLEASDAPVVVGRIAVDSDVINGGKQDGSNVLTQNFEASEGVINGGSEAEGDDGSAVFVQKILAFLEDPLSGLKWNDAGDAICVHYPEEFAKKTLPLHFKHSKFASFVRQLHLYGFSKSSPPPPPAHPVHEFRHRHLLRHDLSLARFIRRKVPVQSAAPINIEFQQLSQQVQSLTERQDVMDRQQDDIRQQNALLLQMNRQLMQQNDESRQQTALLWQQNALLWQEMERQRADVAKLHSNWRNLRSILQPFFTNRRPRIVGGSGQQLIEYQDRTGDAEADSATPLKRAREEVDGAGVDDSAAVFEQVFQMARTGMDGSRDASGIPFTFGISGTTPGLHLPMIASSTQLIAAQAANAPPTPAIAAHQDACVQEHDPSQQLQSNACLAAPSSNNALSPVVTPFTLSPAVTPFDLDEFRDLQSQTRQLSDQIADFELVWTPRSSGDGDAAELWKFSDNFSDNESE